MIMMVVGELQETTKELIRFFRERSFNIINYNSPVKALDNLSEIAPDAVLINAVDFPRHWKIITQYIRWDVGKEDIILILAVGEDFSALDADKALKSGIQGIIRLNDSAENILNAAESIYLKYKPLTPEVFDKKLLPDIHFLFTEPLNEIIVTGKVNSFSASGIVFTPDSPVTTMNIEIGSIIEQCSLKIKNKIIVPKCKINYIDEFIDFEFIDLNQQDKETISNFIDGKL